MDSNQPSAASQLYTVESIPDFRIRCSAIGKIMTDSRGKSVPQQIEENQAAITEKRAKLADMKPTLKTYAKLQEQISKLEAKVSELEARKDEPNLSETCKTYLEQWVTEKLYQRRVDFTAKTTDKGNLVEDDAILYLSCHVPGFEFATKNTQYFADEFMHGTPDIIEDEIGADVKSSYNHSTFPLHNSELETTDYEWQMQGYMHLTGRQKWFVIYCLMSMPEEMLIKEARYRLGADYSKDDFEALAVNYLYDDLPPHLRLKVFELEYDAEKIERVKQRVIECRKYIKSAIIPQILKNQQYFNQQTQSEQ